MKKLIFILPIITLLAASCNTSKPVSKPLEQSINNISNQQFLSAENIDPSDSVIAAKIIDVEPFETIYIKKHDDKLTLVRSEANQTKFSYDLPDLNTLFGEGWNQMPKSIITTGLFAGANFNPGIVSEESSIWIYVDNFEGGIVGGYSRTMYTVNEMTKEFKQVYKFTGNGGNAAEGITAEPITITFGENDLSFKCQETYFKSDTELVLKNCDINFSLYKNFVRREQDLQGKSPYDYTYALDKGYIYYDGKGNKITPQVFTPKVIGNEITLELLYIDQNLIMASFDDGKTTGRFIEIN